MRRVLLPLVGLGVLATGAFVLGLAAARSRRWARLGAALGLAREAHGLARGALAGTVAGHVARVSVERASEDGLRSTVIEMIPRRFPDGVGLAILAVSPALRFSEPGDVVRGLAPPVGDEAFDARFVAIAEGVERAEILDAPTRARLAEDARILSITAEHGTVRLRARGEPRDADELASLLWRAALVARRVALARPARGASTQGVARAAVARARRAAGAPGDSEG